VQAAVSKREMQRLLPDDSSRTLAKATLLGAASSSCSYAAVALARSLFRRGADFTAAMAFEIASTNLVVELAIVIALLLGWEFVLGEFVGGPLMIVLLALVFRAFLKRRWVEEAREQANKGLLGSMEGHAQMDMSARVTGTWWQRLRTPRGFTATADYFVMDWAAIWRDIAVGLLELPEHRLSRARRGARLALLQAGRRARDAPDDEQACGPRARPRPLRARPRDRP
jgi:uncharacterized membrane protein YraQ (UPF0718 family)